MPKKINCSECGDLEFALIDGYAFGERLLEGVLFEIRIVNGAIESRYHEPDDAKALFKTKAEAGKWRKEAEAFVGEMEDSLECPKCHLDCAVIE
jgi:hypothetical protein